MGRYEAVSTRVYRTLGHRKDSLFELMEAVLAGSGPATIVRRTLAPAFRRAWPSGPDALADGSLDVDGCRHLLKRCVNRCLRSI